MRTACCQLRAGAPLTPSVDADGELSQRQYDVIVAEYQNRPTKTVNVAHQLHLSRFTQSGVIGGIGAVCGAPCGGPRRKALRGHVLAWPESRLLMALENPPRGLLILRNCQAATTAR